MRIIVLIKEALDTYGDRALDLETGLAVRESAERVLDEIDERALEVALTCADAREDVEVVVLTMAPEWATTTVRKALAMGATSAVHVADDQLAGADLGLTARVLAAAIARAEFDLVIAGNTSTDGGGGTLPAMIAEHLGVAHATALASVEIGDDVVTGTRAADGGVATVTVATPAVISITEALPDGRFATFKSIMAAKKKPSEVLALADLEVEIDLETRPQAILTAVSAKPPRAAGITITDDGDAGQRLADYLIEQRLA